LPAVRWKSMLFFAAVIATFNALKFAGII
jgi:hypothetical protein